MKPRVRFAPSPTGYVHIGGLRTALYNYLFAKNQGGTYLVRVEDTDQTRLVGDAIEGMIDAMTWAGVEHEEGPFIDSETGDVVQKGAYGPYIQSERLALYKEHADVLLDKGAAYYCFCSKERLDSVREAQKAAGETPKYDGCCRGLSREDAENRIAAGDSHVLRLKLPENRVIEFEDAIKGKIEVNTNDMDDQVLMKADGFPTYHMAVVVDDHHMGITHVVRGDEWLISTPKHIFTYEAFGWEAPQFVHLPVILGQNKKKLSKRQGDVAVEDFKAKGYLPEALVNYIALVGWSPEDGEEIMDMPTLIEKFSFDRVSKSSGVFDVDKLNYINNHYIKAYDLDQLTALCKPYFIEAGFADEATFDAAYDRHKKIVSVLRERLNKLEDIKAYFELFTNHTFELEDEEAAEMIGMAHVGAMLECFEKELSAYPNILAADVKKALKAVQKETGHKGKNLFMPVRVAVTGQVHGPDIAEVIEILGLENTLKRVSYSREKFCTAK